LLEERLDDEQDVFALSRLVGEVMTITQERDELLPIVATLVTLTSSNLHTANIQHQMVITSTNAKIATAINPRAKLPLKNFYAIACICTTFYVFLRRKHWTAILLLGNRNPKIGAADIKSRANRQEKKEKNFFTTS
jgi:hypothetical protein